MLNIYQAFVESFQSEDFGIDVVCENESAPSSSNSYAELQMGLFEKKPFTLSDSDQIEGGFRVILRYPEGSEVNDAREKIEAYYKIGLSIELDGNEKAVISGFSKEVGEVEDGWYKLILNVRYRAIVKRG